MELYAIINPTGRLYKFLFHGQFDECNIADALEYVREWAWSAGKEWVIHRQKQRNIPRQGLFEISAWLK